MGTESFPESSEYFHPLARLFAREHFTEKWFYVQMFSSDLSAVVDRVQDKYRGADKSLARPGKKQATATEDFDVHISYLLS